MTTRQPPSVVPESTNVVAVGAHVRLRRALQVGTQTWPRGTPGTVVEVFPELCIRLAEGTELKIRSLPDVRGVFEVVHEVAFDVERLRTNRTWVADPPQLPDAEGF